MRKEPSLDFDQDRAASVVVPPEGDDQGASDLLEIIERESKISPKRENQRKAPSTVGSEGPVPLELLYFRSFGVLFPVHVFLNASTIMKVALVFATSFSSL